MSEMFRRLWNDLERFRPFAGMVRAFARVCMVFAWVGSWQLVAYRCRAGRSLRRVLPRYAGSAKEPCGPRMVPRAGLWREWRRDGFRG